MEVAAAMFATLGNALCMTTTIFAALICAGVAITFVYSASEGNPTIPVVGLVIAGMIWLAGRACRYVLDGHRDLTS
jgi:hypothetical protein